MRSALPVAVLATAALTFPGRIAAQSQAVLLARVAAGWSRIEATITGRVTGPAAAAVGGARVTIKERASVRVTTPPGGQYRLVLPADTLAPRMVTLVATAEGYSPAERRVVLGPGPQEFALTLSSDPLGRDRPLETVGLSGVPARRLPFVTGVVQSRDLDEVPAVSAAGGLAGRMSGVRMVLPTGNPGSAPVLQLRGATSINGASAPLIIIDGTLAGTNLADFSPEDIERFEVSKGPAAAASYGSNAANGVIQIFTKRGRELAEGDISFTTRNEAGRSTVGALANSSGAHPYQMVGGGEFLRDAAGRRIPEFDGIADNPYPVLFDPQPELFPSGTFLSNQIAIAGRRGPRTFRASFQRTATEGVVFGLTGFRRENYRLNLDQRLGRRVDLELSGGYATSNDRDGLQEVGGAFFSWRFVEPQVDLLADNPNGSPYRADIPDRIGNAANPLYRLATQERDTDRSRLIGGVAVRWRALDWLTAEGGYHADRERRDFSDLTPPGFLTADGTPTTGLYQTDRSEVQRTNFGGQLTAVGHGRRISGALRAGVLYEDQSEERRTRAASSPEPNADEFASAFSFASFNVSSVFAESFLDLGRRLTLDGMARREVISMLAPGVRTPWYYRVAGGLRLFGESSLRVAYGTSGLRRALEFSLQDSETAPDGVRAPYSAELEFGAHLGDSRGRVTFDYSFSRKRTRNQVGMTPVSTPSGFINVLANIGVVESRSHEASLGLAIVDRPRLRWSLAITAERSRGRITEYLPPASLGGSGFQPGVFLLRQGAGLGVMHGNRAVRTIDELYDDPAKAGQRGPGEDFDPENFVVNEEGYVVLREGWRTPNERPITYATCASRNAAGACLGTTDVVEIGDGTPDFVAGFSTRFTWGGFGVSGLVAWSQGGDVYNGTRQWPFFEQRDRVFDQRGKPEIEKKPVSYYRTFFNGLGSHAFFVESGTFVKVRELSVSYTFRSGQLRSIGLGGMQRLKLGLVGRNLFTFTGYSGEDPEVATLSGDPFQRRIDWFGYPHYRTISAVVEIAF